jgi:hypothetical protein
MSCSLGFFVFSFSPSDNAEAWLFHGLTIVYMTEGLFFGQKPAANMLFGSLFGCQNSSGHLTGSMISSNMFEISLLWVALLALHAFRGYGVGILYGIGPCGPKPLVKSCVFKCLIINLLGIYWVSV